MATAIIEVGVFVVGSRGVEPSRNGIRHSVLGSRHSASELLTAAVVARWSRKMLKLELVPAAITTIIAPAAAKTTTKWGRVAHAQAQLAAGDGGGAITTTTRDPGWRALLAARQRSYRPTPLSSRRTEWRAYHPTDEATNREHRSPRHSDERVFRRRRTCLSAYPSALYLSHEPGSDSGGDGARKDFGARTWPKSLLLLARRDSSHSAYAKRTRSETRSITVVNRWIIEGSNNERYYKKKERNKADR